MINLADLTTPAALIDKNIMQNNILRMQKRITDLGADLRPHVKTSKSLPVVKAQIAAGAKGITVSTLKEATYFFENGITDIVYAVCISPNKLERVLQLQKAGCDLKIITDSPKMASEIVRFAKERGTTFKVMIEIDSDAHRSGIRPEEHRLIETAGILHKGGITVAGVLTHAGSSYDMRTRETLEQMAEQERIGVVNAAEKIRAKGIPCPVVSVGSTPTAFSAVNLNGVTEVRAGVYVFCDLVMKTIGVCTFGEIALSVLATVIGHQKEKGWAIVDAGWMAMSRDQGTRTYGYGQVLSVTGEVLDYIVEGVNQEHGIISSVKGVDTNIEESLPLGSLVRILPNHACATSTQFGEYYAFDERGALENWPRIHGW